MKELRTIEGVDGEEGDEGKVLIKELRFGNVCITNSCGLLSAVEFVGGSARSPVLGPRTSELNIHPRQKCDTGWVRLRPRVPPRSAERASWVAIRAITPIICSIGSFAAVRPSRHARFYFHYYLLISLRLSLLLGSRAIKGVPRPLRLLTRKRRSQQHYCASCIVSSTSCFNACAFGYGHC